MADKTAKKQRGIGKPFKKGQSGNPQGRPKGTTNYLARLEEAIEKYKKEKNKDIFERFIERAFLNDKVLIAAIKKFVPDREKTEIEGSLSTNIDMSGLTIEQLKKLAYEIDNSTKKGNSKTGKD